MTAQSIRVGQVVFGRAVAGAERHVAELCCALRQRGHDCHVLVPDDIPAELSNLYAAVATVHPVAVGAAPVTALRLRRLSSDLGLQLIHTHMGQAAVAGLAAGLSLGLPVLTTVHFVELGHAEGPGAVLRRPVYAWVMRRMTRVVAVSGAAAEMVEAAFSLPSQAVSVIHNGVGCLDREGVGVAPGEATVLYAGRVEPEKRLDLLIRSLAPHKGLRLVVAGVGSAEPAARALADQLMPGRTSFLGFSPDVPALIGAAAVIAVPSRREGFGLVAVEAMRGGRPVVGFRSGGLTEIIDDGATGSLVPQDDVAAFGAAVAAICADPALAARMGAAGRQRYLERFTSELMAERTEALYAACLA